MSILSVNHLSKKINNKIILKNISFSLDEGHIAVESVILTNSLKI